MLWWHSSMNVVTALEYHISTKRDGACMADWYAWCWYVYMYMMVRVFVGICWCMYMLVRVHVYVGTCICTCWYMYMLVYVGTCMCTCWCVCRYMWRNRWSWQINKIHDAMYHKLVVLTQTLWEWYPWHIDSGIEEWKYRGKYRRILLIVYYHLSLTWENIRNLIGWEEYNTGRICTLNLIPVLPD